MKSEVRGTKPEMHHSILNGVLIQGTDEGNFAEWKEVGGRETTESEKADLEFSNIVCKHLKKCTLYIVMQKWIYLE